MVGIMSAAGIVGFLSEPDPELQAFALHAANEQIDVFWAELAEAVGQIEAMYEDESFPERELAALVVAKVYYHLQAYDESMVYALGAGKLFDIEHEGEFEETIIAKCIDTYISLNASRGLALSTDTTDKNNVELNDAFASNVNGSASTAASLTSSTTPFSHSTLPSKSLLSRDDSSTGDSSQITAILADSQAPSHTPLSKGTQKNLQGVIRRIFERCFQAGAYRQVLGIAVEARNLDVMRETISRVSDESDKSGKSKPRDRGGRREELMDYLLDICMNVVQERSLRNDILQLIVDLLLSNEVASPDYFAIAKCLVYLDQHSMASNLLRQLVEQDSPKSLAVAYQISFDLYDNSTQEFLAKVLQELPQTEEENPEFSITNEQGQQSNPADPNRQSEGVAMGSGSTDGVNHTSTVVSRSKEPAPTEVQRKAYSSIREIMLGAKSIEFQLEFLFRANKSDKAILNKIKSSLEARNSIFHSAVNFANAFMNSGTTNDWFIRENLDWLNKAVNWSKFSVTAALGVIHKGAIGQGQKLLEPYLKDTAGAGSAYSKGGALFALGLIYTKHGKQVMSYLHNQLRNAVNEDVVQHGAALGLGVAGMASGDEEIVEELKSSALHSESTISGQAAGLAIGLVMLGSGDKRSLTDMIGYAHDTEHDKTIRGLALGMALIMYARQEDADELINGLLEDPDPTLRYGGIMTIALAYCGTSSNKAVRRLLHVAVSDVNDDMRRTAVMALGFVLFRKPSSVPRMVELLAESYNPHVRYGATMALGIACAGTGLEEAVDLLEPMMKDSTDFVRQGAFIALSMIMVQQTEAMNSKSASVRKTLMKVIGDRHEDAMAKFGAAIALGIIDAGGRNCTISLQTQTGNLNMTAIVGMAVFTQYWYWFPLTHFLSLSFTPTTVIAVDQDLDVPNLKLHCASRPSMFDYPPALEVKTEEAPEKVKTAVLSTTAQAKRRKLAKERQHRQDSMEVDQTPTTPKPSEGDDKMELDDKDKDEKSGDTKKDGEATPSTKTSKSKPEKEKVGYEIDNMSRVLAAQVKYVSLPEGRYVPMKKPTGGVVLLLDTQPSEPKSLVEKQVKKPPPRTTETPANQGSRSTTAPTGQQQAQQSQQGTAADAAAVLTAVDEDDEGVEEAQPPDAFDYFSDGEEDGGA